MRYTQLDFAPYSPERRSLVKQAKFLLRELVAGRVHQFPCDCGACIYWAYRRAGKGEGRSFSARTFFVYFLRFDLSWKTLVESLPIDRGQLKRKSKWRRMDVQDRRRLRKEPGILFGDVYWADFREAARRSTLAMIRELAGMPQPPAMKKFLRGILNKKSFYTYYRRAGDAELGQIVQEMRKKLGSMVER